VGKDLVRSEAVALKASVPALYVPTAQAAKRFIEYFAANNCSPNTRRGVFPRGSRDLELM
jgi:hypothetical protein